MECWMQQVIAQDELFKYDRMITSFYYSNLHYFNCSVSYLDLEDVLQEMRINILNLIPKYDPTKGATLSTFIFLSLKRKLIDLRAKAKRRKKYCLGTIEEFAAKNSISVDSDGESDPDQMMNYLFHKASNGASEQQDALCDFIDASNILEALRPNDRDLYIDRYVNGYSYNQLAERHDRSKENLRKRLRRIDKIFDTLRFQ